MKADLRSFLFRREMKRDLVKLGLAFLFFAGMWFAVYGVPMLRARGWWWE